VSVERISLPIEHPSIDAVTAAVHPGSGRRRRRSVLLTHGAGGDLDGAGLVALAEVLASQGHQVVRANLPHREQGKRGAPRADRSVGAFKQIVAAAKAELSDDRPWILGGKSYGGRVASMAVADGVSAAGLLFYGYPLHPPGKQDQLRVSHWPAVGVPCLFLQGERDTFCDIGLLEEKVTKLPRRATIHVVPGGDHSLDVSAKAAPDGVRRSAEDVIADLEDVIARWVTTLD
jgi:uncharacterized protein